MDLYTEQEYHGPGDVGIYIFMVIICLVGAGMFALGYCCGARMGRAGLVEKKGMSVQTETPLVHEINTQSQTRYSWNAATPRFVPLAEGQHGCWRELAAVRGA